MKTNTKPLILIDGSSYLYRAFHAMPSLMNSKGFPTGAVYGVTNMLRKLLNDYDPDYIAVIFDTKGKTFRDELYEPYKANRSAMPDDLVKQIESIHEVIRAMGLPLIMIEGVEADDVIGTLAKKAEKENRTTLISTGDKDLAQLVNEHITLINTMTNTTLTPITVKEKFGVSPSQIIDYLTLVGDSVDNIPGVPQVGPKTAVKWLEEYGSLDHIIQKADTIKGKVGDNLRHSLSQLPLTKQLVTIKEDVDLPFDWHLLKRKEPHQDQLIELYKTLEFKSWLNDLLEKKAPAKEEKYQHYETILNENDFNRWLALLEKASVFAFDTETTSLNYMEAVIVGLSFALEPGKACYIPLAHDYENAPPQLNRETILAKLKPILENPHIKKIGHNLKYDMEVLLNHGIQLQGIAFDTMLESYVVDSTGNRHDMDACALKFLGWRTIPYEEIVGKGVKQISFNHVTLEKASCYASEDADVTLQLHHALFPKIQKEKGLKTVFEEIEMPLVPVLALIERKGVLIDVKKLEKQSIELETRLDELQKAAFILAEGEFNMNSPKQLQEILFEKLKLPVLQKTPTGQASTADPILQELALDYEIAKLIIEYRSLSKLISTYTKRLPEQINPATGRVHTSYNQTGAATGRLSSSDPNLQNIPIRTTEGKRIRQAFIAPPGYKLISADYSQIELRIMAHISKDPALVRAFEQNLDVHKATASEITGIPLDQITSEERRRAKAVNFGLMYGMSAFGLAKQIGVDRNTAENYIERYFARYPLVKAYIENTRIQANEKGFVETLWGRRLYLPEIHSSQIPRKKAAERTAINAPLQGSGADIIKRAMIEIQKWLDHAKVDAAMIMQVHDELVFEVAEKDVEKTVEAIRAHMTHAAELNVPLLVDIGVGENWDDASA